MTFRGARKTVGPAAAAVFMAVLTGTTSGCANPWLLSAPSTSQGTLPAMPTDRATIVVLWPSMEDEGYAVNIVTSDTHQVQAQLDGGEWTALDVPAGELELYFAPGHREASNIPRPVPELLTGEVAAGRIYLVHYDPHENQLEVLEAGSPLWASTPEWFATLRRVDCNRPLAARYSNERGAALHEAHAQARERYLRLSSAARERRTFHPDRQPPQRSPAVATVHYRAGGAVRGVVIEYLPGVSITVHAPGGAPTQSPMGLVQRVDFE